MAGAALVVMWHGVSINGVVMAAYGGNVWRRGNGVSGVSNEITVAA